MDSCRTPFAGKMAMFSLCHYVSDQARQRWNGRGKRKGRSASAIIQEQGPSTRGSGYRGSAASRSCQRDRSVGESHHVIGALENFRGMTHQEHRVKNFPVAWPPRFMARNSRRVSLYSCPSTSSQKIVRKSRAERSLAYKVSAKRTACNIEGLFSPAHQSQFPFFPAAAVPDHQIEHLTPLRIQCTEGEGKAPAEALPQE